MKTIIAGGRDYLFTKEDEEFLNSIKDTITEVIHGCASGADKCASIWATKSNIPIRRFPADWNKHGRAAGPIRNELMAAYAAPIGQCILFPGGRGTENMYNNAVKYGLKIIDKRK